MFSTRPITSRIATAFAFACIISTVASAGTVTVTPTVTSLAGIFHYDYSIANNTADEVLLVDISVPHSATSIQNLMAPTGFSSAFDPGLGLVSFIEDTAMFGSVPVSGFMFDSTFAPAVASFAATVLNSTTGGLSTVTGSTSAPAPSAVPEPGYMGLLAGSLLVLVFNRKRIRGRV